MLGSGVVVVVVGEDGDAWTWVSGADVKLLFGHLSDRRPRRLPVSVKSVRGHQPRRCATPRQKSSTLYFYFHRATCLSYFPKFYLQTCVETLEFSRLQWSNFKCLKAIRHRKMGRSSDAHCLSSGKVTSLIKIPRFLFLQSTLSIHP